MATSIRTIKRHFVQTSADFSTWDDQPTIRCNQCSEGAGQIVGAASLVRAIGTVREPGATGSPTSQTPVTGLCGKWVRVLIEDAAGSVTISSVKYAPLWHGIVDGERISDLGGGSGLQSWSCSGLAADLARRAVTDGWVEVTKADGTKLAGHYIKCPTLNDPNGRGGASAATYSINGYPSSKIPAIGGSPLTAKELLQHILSTHADWYNPATGTWVRVVTWALSAGTLLDFKAPCLGVSGSTVLDVVNFCINPRRGLIWRLSVSGSTATINVLSIAASAIGSLPAATDTATPDLSGLWCADVELTEDQTATYDRIDIIGGSVCTGMSLAFDPANATPQAQSLIKGWTDTGGSDEETAWADGSGAINDKVWRTFVLNPRWDGRNYGSSTVGIANAPSLSVGTTDYDGGRIFYPLSSAGVPVDMIDLVPWLPCGEGFTVDVTGDVQQPLAFIRPKGSSTWYDLQSNKNMARSMAVGGPPTSVAIGDAYHAAPATIAESQQRQNKLFLEGTGVLVVTVGVKEYNPLRISWTRDSADWPRGIPRTLVLHMVDCVYNQVLSGTVTGVSGGSLTTTSNIVVRNDLPTMQAALQLARAYYSIPARALQWTDRGNIEYAYGSGAAAPGALVTTATLGTGSTTINAVVTRRTWTLAEDGYGTNYDTDRIAPDVEAIR